MTMNKMLLAAIMAAAMVEAAGAQDPAVRPGLWEVRLVRQYMDGRDVTALVPVALNGMQQLMANMTPQQRAQMDATFGRAPASTTQRICVSPEMAAGDKPLLPPDVKCDPVSFNRAGGQVTFEFVCNDQGRSTTGKGTSELSSERVVTRIDMVTEDSATGRHTWQNQCKRPARPPVPKHQRPAISVLFAESGTWRSVWEKCAGESTWKDGSEVA